MMVLMVPGGLHVMKLLLKLVKNSSIRFNKKILSILRITDKKSEYFATYQHLQNLFYWPIFQLTKFLTYILLCLISVYFMHKYLHIDRKNHMICIFAVIQVFMLPSDHTVSRANEIGIYILYII